MYVGLRRGGLGALPLCADSCPPDAQWVPCLKIPLLALQVKRVRCESSGVLVPKDKAIKRFIVRNMVDASAIRDLQEACTIDSEYLGYGKGVAGARRWRAPARQGASSPTPALLPHTSHAETHSPYPSFPTLYLQTTLSPRSTGVQSFGCWGRQADGA